MAMTPSYLEEASLNLVPIPLEIQVNGCSWNGSIQVGDTVTYWSDYEEANVSFKYLGTDPEGLLVIDVSQGNEEKGYRKVHISQIHRLISQITRIQSADGEIRYVKPGEEEVQAYTDLHNFRIPNGPNDKKPAFRNVDWRWYQNSPSTGPVKLSVNGAPFTLNSGDTLDFPSGDSMTYMCCYREEGVRAPAVIQFKVHLRTGKKYIMGISLPDLSTLLNTFSRREA